VKPGEEEVSGRRSGMHLPSQLGGKFTEGWADFELKDGKLMRIMGIGVKPPLHPAPHLVSFRADL